MFSAALPRDAALFSSRKPPPRPPLSLQPTIWGFPGFALSAEPKRWLWRAGSSHHIPQTVCPTNGLQQPRRDPSRSSERRSRTLLPRSCAEQLQAVPGQSWQPRSPRPAELSPVPTSPSQRGAAAAQPCPVSPRPRPRVRRKGPARRSIPRRPFSGERDPDHAAQGLWTQQDQGNALLSAPKLRTDTADSPSPGVPSAPATALRSSQHELGWEPWGQEGSGARLSSRFCLLCSSPSQPALLTALTKPGLR